MKYTHPKEYKGLRFNTERSQIRMRAIVEEYCLKCDLFIGKEHDFSECRMADKWKDRKVIAKKTCPFPNLAVPIDIETLKNSYIKCEVEEGFNG